VAPRLRTLAASAFEEDDAVKKIKMWTKQNY
jgi:hypothetical protein